MTQQRLNACPKCGGYVDHSARLDDPTCVNCGWQKIVRADPKPNPPERTEAQRRSEGSRLARLIGLTEGEYLARVNAGLKWCQGCRLWHAVAQFSPDVNKSTGISSNCRVAEAKRAVRRRVGWAYPAGES